ncbi:hypothetical protein NL529_27605, partial [Klebsiella pneumoniae]|nr:hypothetical protein [Klebsiella pneumoniae]
MEVTDISYTVISEEELNEIAVFEANNTEDTGLRSVNDPRGGTIDEHALCATCNQDNLTCPGHFGKIVLNRKIIHPLFRREV